MLGAIVGDIVGSSQKFTGDKTKNFQLLDRYSRFTDDTVTTLAIAEALMEVIPQRGVSWSDNRSSRLETAAIRWLQEYGRRYPYMYSGNFDRWINSSTPKPYRSFGNGAASRVSPAAWAFDNFDDVKLCALVITRITHNHGEGIKGALSTVTAIFKARQGETQNNIKKFIEKRYGYDLSQTLDEIRPSYDFDRTCQGTVPEAITAFLEAENFEDAIRKAVSLGGDCDTLAAITGAIAEGAWDIPDELTKQIFERLDPFLQDTLTRWEKWREDAKR